MMARFRSGGRFGCPRPAAELHCGRFAGLAHLACPFCRVGTVEPRTSRPWRWEVCDMYGAPFIAYGYKRTRSAALRAIRREIARRIAAESAPKVLTFSGGIATGRAEVRL